MCRCCPGMFFWKYQIKDSSIMTFINTYVNEMTLKLILGTELLSKYDDFAAQLKKMNIEEAIRIRETDIVWYNTR
jgi:putative aldouronate transport system substrate-binding protein